MLMCKDLRWCHQRPLMSALHRLDKREQGDCRLTRTDIPLHKTAHREWRLHIACDLPPHLRLILCQVERECRKHTRDKLAVRSMCNAFLLLCRTLLECEQSALDEIEFLERKPPPRRAQFLLTPWKVNLSKGGHTSDEMIFFTNALRQILCKLPPSLRESVLHHLPQLFLCQSLRRRIDGQNAEMCLCLIACTEHFKRCDVREGDLPASVIGIVRLAREEDAPSLAQL